MSAVFPETFVLFHLPGRLLVWRLGGGGYGRGLKIRDRCTYPLDSLQALPRVLKHFKEEWRPKDDDTLLYGLPLQFFSRVHFSLPLAAAGELDSAVGYELLRHIPYELDSVYFTYSYRVSPSSEDALEVDVSLAPRQPLAPFLQAMSAAGLELSAIFPSLFLLSWWHCQEGIYLSTDGGDAELLVWQDGEIVFHTWHQAVDARSSIIAEARPFWENLGGFVLPVSASSCWQCWLIPSRTWRGKTADWQNLSAGCKKCNRRLNRSVANCTRIRRSAPKCKLLPGWSKNSRWLPTCFGKLPNCCRRTAT
ncbi:MAG: hypothetical protein BZ151_12740 [Desulfobacca sp. 4484_104]|nr:MAG: hypothetical protein BZ151_12740 [Desulfobacca sp. 4484_104]